MTDGPGSTNYQYNQLSQITSEARTFSGLGPYTLSYDYNLAGTLQKITDPTNTTINYGYDLAGRLSSVTGSDHLYGGVSQYASGLTYRAWGGIKGVTYGNNYTLAVSYNSRLQGTQFELAGRPAQYGSSTVMKTQFEYYADGATRYAHDLLDERFDRAYSYDSVGMVKEAYSGSEARDYMNGTSSGTATGPYKQTYQRDGFGHLTDRLNRYWSRFDHFSASYSNNRRQGAPFDYDAAGNLTQDNNLQYLYDAAGRNASTFISATNTTISPSFDGDGQGVKRSENDSGNVTTTYYLHSTVLEGKVLAELNAQGQKQKGYVFAGNQVLAEQQSGGVIWKHENPLTGSLGSSNSQGMYSGLAELDPEGVNVGFENPYSGGGGITPEIPGLFAEEDASDGTCALNKMPFDCALLSVLADNGALASEIELSNGRRMTEPIHSFGLGLSRVWNPGHPIDIPHDEDVDTIRIYADETHGSWTLYSFNFAPQKPGVEFLRDNSGNQSYAPDREGRILKAITALYTGRCTAAFTSLGLENPMSIVNRLGIVVEPSTLAQNPSGAAYMGIPESGRAEMTSNGDVGSSYTKAMSFMGKYNPDGRGRIFLNGSAFRAGLLNVLAHEFIHLAGVRGVIPSKLKPWQDDLSFDDKYQKVIDTCVTAGKPYSE